MKNPFRSIYRVTSPFGYRELNMTIVYHAGIDLVCDRNKTVVSTDEGTVVVSQIVTDRNNLTWQWGNYVCVQRSDGTQIYYCHLDSRAVNAGDKVHVGSVIGVMGNTGYSFGAHLHYEVRRNGKVINAADFLGIKNEIGTAVPLGKDEDGMTEAEKIEFEALKREVEALKKDYQEHTATRYETIADVPDWAEADIQWLISNNYLRGTTDGKIKLGYDMLRELCIMSRALQYLSANQFDL